MPSDAAPRSLPMTAWAALGALFAYRLSTTIVDLDLFHQMALAREWRALGALPRVDLWAFTPTAIPFIHHEWGAGVVAYWVAATAGGPGILLLRYALGFATATIAVRTALRIGASPFVVLGLAPVAMLLVESGYPPLRAHAYSFLFAAVTLRVCELDREGRRAWLWALVPLFMAWVNLHGGFAFGLVLLGAYGAERALQRDSFMRVGLVLLAILAAVRVNPYGWTYYSHVFSSLRIDRSLVPEWEPLWNGRVPLQEKIAFCSAAGLVVYGFLFGRGMRGKGVLLMSVTALASVLHHRLLPFFGIAWLVYCPDLLRGSLLHDFCLRLARYPRSLLCASGAAALAAAILLWNAHPVRLLVPNDPAGGDPDGAPYYPVGAVAYLREQRFEGNLLTPFNQGSYVLWKLYPSVKVSLDSRYEAAYEPAMAEELIRLYQTGENLTGILERYRPDAILVPRHSGLAKAVIPFRQVYEDSSFRVYAGPGVSLTPFPRGAPSQDRFP